jgi:hypothetical protein
MKVVMLLVINESIAYALCCCPPPPQTSFDETFLYEYTVTKREGPRQQPDPLTLYCIACDWSSIHHTNANRAFRTTHTNQNSLEPLQTQILLRDSKIELHNSDCTKRTTPTQASNLLKHQAKV